MCWPTLLPTLIEDSLEGMILATLTQGGLKEVTTVSASHEDIERRAFQLWQDRGCPVGSPEVDWEQAEGELSLSPGPPGEAGGMASGVRPSAGPPQDAQHNR